MQILVVSDIHRRRSYFEKVLEKYPNINTVFFLGDGVDDAEDVSSFYSEKNFHLLSGNCDFFSNEKSEQFVVIENIVMFITHGDKYGVKYTLNYLYDNVKDLGVNLVCFGHTHKFENRIINNITFLNPGSLSDIRGNSQYVVLTIDGKKFSIEKFSF